jgi:2-dehydro-3-deoxygluconokinase
LIRWVEFDGIGRAARNGLNFTERGFGVRAAAGCSDRGHSAVSQVRTGQIDWDEIFGKQGARWFHTGGIFCGLSGTTPELALEAVQAAKGHGVMVSYDLNYRASVWKGMGGKPRAQKVNRRMAAFADLLIGNEEDFSAALGFEVEGADSNLTRLDVDSFRRMLEQVAAEFSVPVIGATLRQAITATRNDWGAICLADGVLYEATQRPGLEIYDRVGGGDAFASGMIYGFLSGKAAHWCVECGAAHGALAMTTPGDTTMATLAEVLQVMQGNSARITR